MPDRTCETRFPFRHWLLFRPELLSMEWPVLIAGRRLPDFYTATAPLPATFLLPSREATAATSGYGLLNAPPTARVQWLRKYTGREPEWGEICEPSSRISWVRASVLRASCSGTDDKRVEEIALGAFPWMERLCHWLAALTGQTLTSDEIPSGGPVLSFVIEDDKGDIKPFGLGVSGGKPRVLGRLDISQAISVDAWRRALKAASDTEPLPAEHEVLNHARTLLLEGDSRGSVIAAGSAAEIALSRALHGRLSSANEPVAVATLMDRTTLGRLPGLAKRFGVPCPPIKRLTDARNDAVHRGVVPFLQDASELLDIADAVVKMHSPLVA